MGRPNGRVKKAAVDPVPNPTRIPSDTWEAAQAPAFSLPSNQPSCFEINLAFWKFAGPVFGRI
jgi:hypothetical protein